MSDHDRKRLRAIHTFPALVKYLREDLEWPVEQDDFYDMDLDDLTFDWDPEELGIDSKQAAKIEYVKQLRPLKNGQPQGVFFVKFDTNILPVVALRKLLASLVVKKRATAKAADRPLWEMRDLVFISSYGETEERQLSFAYFQEPEFKGERPALKVLGWDDKDAPLHLDAVHDRLHAHLAWPEDPKALPAWRRNWSTAFREGHGESVRTAKDLAKELARLARGIRERAKQLLKLESEKGPLRTLMEAFKTALIHDLTDEQFADMYAQTIAYGLLSARITHPDPVNAETLPDLIPVTNPFLKELMETFVLAGGKHPGKRKAHQIDFDELGINDVVGLLRRANMQSILENFGNEDRKEDPVTYFYEDFLNEYDAEERKRRGVYYTPKPVVSCIVRSVHEMLQTEFGIEDGLASTITWGEMAKRHQELKIPVGTSAGSPFVQILDPATGTATFLVTVIEVIYKTLKGQWGRDRLSEDKQAEAWNNYVPKHLLPRLYGYELMMAPYAIAHLKIGLKLFETGYRFESPQRARIYLTNALELATDASNTQIDALSEALAHEAEAVNHIKRTQLFTAVVGNPPYAGHSLNNQLPWIVDRVYDYKRGYPDLQKPGQAKWLQDDYVKFLRFAQWQIERSNHGVVGLITNHAWLDNPTFKGMRQSLMDCFDRIAVLDLHGNANKPEVASDGSPDKNVFDIKQGVAITLLATAFVEASSGAPRVSRGDILGTAAYKYDILATKSLSQLICTSIAPLPPKVIFTSLDDNRKREYDMFWSMPAIMNQNGDPAPGIVTTHDAFAISYTRPEQVEKVETLIATRTEAEARRRFRLCSQSQWVYADARRELRTGEWQSELTPILYRPFDERWTVYNRYVAVHRRERVSRHMLGGRNVALITCRQRSAHDSWAQVFVTNLIIESTAISNKTKEINYLFPLWLEPEWPETRRRTNLSPDVLRKIASATGLVVATSPSEGTSRRGHSPWHGCGDLSESFGPRDVFDFAYGILHSIGFRQRYSDFLRSDFPRIPCPGSARVFGHVTRLGRELISLHLLESSKLGRPIATYSGPGNPEVGRVGWSSDTVWLDAAAARKGQLATPGTMGFKGVSEAVWNFHIGGYRVCEKWLKDRKGRKLLKADIEHYQQIVVALSETVRIMKEIDQIIDQHGGWPGAFVSTQH